MQPPEPFLSKKNAFCSNKLLQLTPKQNQPSSSSASSHFSVSFTAPPSAHHGHVAMKSSTDKNSMNYSNNLSFTSEPSSSPQPQSSTSSQFQFQQPSRNEYKPPQQPQYRPVASNNCKK